MNNPITFLDLANAFCLSESAAEVSLSIPPMTQNLLDFRSFCISDLLLKKVDLQRISKFNWGEVCRVLSENVTGTVIVLVQFESCIQPFPIELPQNAYSGHKDSIINNLRKIEREFPDRINAWSIITKNGMRIKEDPFELLFKMKRMINTKTNHVSR
ncbi:hypothetical protein [Paenibacillus sp. FSL P4-0288]|uniref:hypothetical protein n=1 Tax=Paenibacillus sp. FSL P4-0288 TaxID=2921633 RepID=UPI0030FB4233